MSLPPDYWTGLASDYVAAYKQAFPTAGGASESLPLRSAVCLCMAVAEHETNNGRAWPGTNNFGAVQLRRLTPDELAAFQAGTLKAGDYNADRTGVLHVDTHPGPGGSVPYPVWFAAFARRIDGIAHFLKVLYRLSTDEPDREGADSRSLALAMYLHGYFEGGHPGARPVSLRAAPFNAAELANVSDYAGAVEKCLVTILAALQNWDFGGDPIPTDPGDRATTVRPGDPAA